MSALSNFRPLVVFTVDTPNGQKVTNFTEELKRAYGSKTGFNVKYRKIDMSVNEHKADWYLKINPNGRIPAITDPNRGDFNVFETAAILLYLEQHYDPDHLFSWPSTDPKADNYRSEVMQWMFFVHGGIGPMQGQANHFARAAPEKIPYAINRYKAETQRLYSVLDARLKDRDYLVGEGRGKFSLADMNGWTWCYRGPLVVPEEEIPQSVKAWIKRCWDRPASKIGMGATNNGKLGDWAKGAWSKESGLAPEE
ncbi:glutathione S-transferase [Tilletiaria anomala UBC 951]|uniref:Glutathione S-transferase n=1 Tax=Tilletiaria anomala (strain ATCC 24038 / CBS 436.72 / UBC 951) TaxID=1037660 RepID=A0A066VZ36_TILAU|nr:glutathione S-transferase [Tilletiaria anomala UBC 951]KDN44079.1 glutathione S-transferase [Tilletiaria anomala UBC 951]